LTLLSVIVVADGAPVHLREVLEAALSTAGSGIELLVVDTGAHAATSWVIDEVASSGRLRVLRPAEPLDRGGLHRFGGEEALGDYLLFLDTQTIPLPGALETITGRLEAQPVDLLVLGGREVRWWERTKRQRRRRVRPVRRAPDRPFDWQQVPAVFPSSVDGPSEVVGRSLFERTAHLLAGGVHSGFVWRAAVRLDASAILADERQLLEWHPVHPPGHGRSSIDDHAELFALAERLACTLESRGRSAASDAVRRATLVRGARLLDLHEGRWTFRERRRFFSASRRAHRGRWRGALPRGVRLALLRTGRHLLFEVLRLLSHFARRGPSVPPDPVGEATRRIPGTRLARWVYRLSLLLPLDRRLAVFAAYGYRSYACNPRAISEELQRRGSDVRAVWVLRSSVPAPPGVDVVRPGTYRYYYVLGRARYFVNNFNFPAHVRHRRGTTNVQTQHGTPLKTMGVDQHRFPRSRGRRRLPLFVEKYRRWDLVLSPSHYASEIVSHAYPGRYEVLEVGFPRNDILVQGDDDRAAATRRRLDIDESRQVVLYAPTFREGEKQFASPLDLSKVAEVLDEDVVLLVRAHYFLTARVDEGTRFGGARVVDVSLEPSIEELFLVTDVLVTDYSSAMFDFALLRRPIVLHVPDLEDYRSRRGLYVDLEEWAPGPITRDERELADALVGLRSAGPSSAAHQRFLARFCGFERGDAARRVVEEVFSA
jgi:CDP-glycerol glycerophosphotransferase